MIYTNSYHFTTWVLLILHRVIPLVPGDAVVTAETRVMPGSRWHKHMRRIR